MFARYLSAALIAASLLSGSAAWAQDQAGLDRLSRRGDLLGWEGVGRIDLASGGFCTGVLIARDLVLTAAHCLYDSQGRVMPPGGAVFRAGLRDGLAIAERSVRRFAVADGYDPRFGTSIDNIRRDVALLQLDRDISTSEADPFRVFSGAKTGDKVSVVSYGRGRAEALSRQRECGLLGQEADILVFDCNVTFGSSGAPVFVREDGLLRVLTLVSAGSRQADGVIAYGMALPDQLTQLKQQLRVASAPVNQPSAGAKRITIGGNKSGTGAKFVRP